MRLASFVSLSFVAVISPGCLSDLSVPEGALIDCRSVEDCPGTHVCSAALGRCVLAGADDQPPSLDTERLAVSPALASAGVTIEIRLQVSEALGAPPLVTLEWAGAPPERIDDVEQTEEGAYLARYLVSGEEPEGFAALAVELVDKDGNRNRSSVPRALELDFTPPTVAADTISVVLEAPERSPIAAVSAAGTGSVVRVLFAASEPLLAPPSIGTEGETPLTFSLTDDIGTFFTFVATVPEGPLPQGAQELVADLVDAAGNEARVSLGELLLDTVAPPAPSVDVQGAVVYRRAPWGSEASGGVPSFTLELAAGSVEAGGVVIVRDDEVAALASELGRSSVVDGSAQEVVLARTDRELVWVSVTDAAGNESAPARVRDVRWLATLIGREARSDLRNPHRVRRSATPLVARESPLLSEPTTPEITRLAARDGSSVVARGERAFQRRAGRMPGARFLSEMVFDRERGVAVVFGGLEGELGLPADTWEWDGGDWAERTPSVAPTGRIGHALVYDAARAETLLFGGFDLTRHSADSWVYDGTVWTDVTPPDESPPPRFASAVAYDPARQRVVLFGGGVIGGYETLSCPGGTTFGDGSCFYGDTWEWDGDQWLARAPASAPAPRAMAALAYDETRGGVVLFGGCTDALEFSNFGCDDRAEDTWLWDGVAWTELTSTLGTPPPGRVAHRLVTTPDGPVLVAGASVGFGNAFETCDTSATHLCHVPWLLDEAGWSPLTSATPLPLGQFPSVTFDDIRAQLVAMYPSDDECEPADSCNRTLVWTPEDSAVVVDLEERPLARSAITMTYDVARERTLLFGGDPRGGACDASGSLSVCDGLWEWDGVGWDLRCTGDQVGEQDYCALRPDARYDAGLVYDNAREHTVLFGGFSGSATCDGTSAGGYCGRTWGWDGTSWTPLCRPELGCASPPPRVHMAMGYDSAREVVVLFGGEGPSGCNDTEFTCGDTWEWDGASWSLVADPGVGPGPRSGSRLAYDEGRDVMVLFGGSRRFGTEEEAIAGCAGARSGQNCRFGDTWEWDGASWSQLTTTDPEGDGDPTPRSDGALAYEAARGRVVLHGGQPLGSEYVDDAWELDGQSWRAVTPRGAIPGPRESHGMTFDRARERLVIFGGDGADEVTWEWPSGALAKSAMLVEISFLASGADTALVEEVQLHVAGGGLGYTLDNVLGDDGDRLGDAVPGAALAVWDARAGRWQPLGTLDGTPDAPSTRDVTSADAAEARRWLGARAQQLAVRLEPGYGGGNGPRGAEVGLDYVEVTVRYRLPAP